MIRDRWQYVAASVAIVAGLSGLAVMGPDHADAKPAPVQTVIPGDVVTAKPLTHAERIRLAFQTLPACEYEDSRDCAWDASERGNGRGHSFVDIGGKAFYLDGWDGKR